MRCFLLLIHSVTSTHDVTTSQHVDNCCHSTLRYGAFTKTIPRQSLCYVHDVPLLCIVTEHGTSIPLSHGTTTLNFLFMRNIWKWEIEVICIRHTAMNSTSIRFVAIHTCQTNYNCSNNFRAQATKTRGKKVETFSVFVSACGHNAIDDIPLTPFICEKLAECGGHDEHELRVHRFGCCVRGMTISYSLTAQDVRRSNRWHGKSNSNE